MNTDKFPRGWRKDQVRGVLAHHEKQSQGTSGPVTHARMTWEKLSPAERLRRSWQLRHRLPSPKRIHDAKLLPSP